MQPDIVKKIIDNGWLQGSLAEIPEHIVEEYNLPTNRFIVATHSCDITNWNLQAIPFVTLLPARIEELDKSTLFGKHARKLQFESQPGLTCQIEKFTYLPRELFSEFKAQAPLSSKDCGIFAKWLGNSYSRSAFPTSFNDRFSSSRVRAVKKEFDKFINFLTKNGKAILNVFIKLNSWDELKQGEAYSVGIVLVISLDFLDSVSQLNDDFDELMVGIFSKCEGIDLENANVLTSDQFTLQDLMEYKLWQMDYISFRDDTETAI